MFGVWGKSFGEFVTPDTPQNLWGVWGKQFGQFVNSDDTNNSICSFSLGTLEFSGIIANNDILIPVFSSDTNINQVTYSTNINQE